MKEVFTFFYYSALTTAILILVGILKGFISFGYGLGDIYPLILIIFSGIFIIIGKLLLSKIKSTSRRLYSIVSVVLYSLFMIISILGLTLLRGPENPWNGNLFINNTDANQGKVIPEDVEILKE